MKRSKKNIIKIVLFLIFVVAILLGARIWYMEEQGNFHAISPGKAYRSAQMDSDELEYYIRKFNIRSIINLRGQLPDKPWYIEEMEVSERLGVTHFDLHMSSDKTPPTHKIKALLALFENVPRPVLIHCKAGADRSGLAAAIWLLAVEKRPRAEAKKQLSILYGHMPVGSTQALDRFFDGFSPPAPKK